MQFKLILIAVVAIVAAPVAQADEATEKAIKKLIMEDNAVTRETLRGQEDTIAKEGSLEFWSSGGLLQTISADLEPGEFESFNITPKHITVITLVPGEIAVAHFYSEGSMHPKGSGPVSDYRTRATQVFVKQDGKWKVRAAHWSPIAGGNGTSATAVDDD